ncbi:hypothetical protein QJQ45_024963, partial [Haematococcus lacustris]
QPWQIRAELKVSRRVYRSAATAPSTAIMQRALPILQQLQRAGAHTLSAMAAVSRTVAAYSTSAAAYLLQLHADAHCSAVFVESAAVRNYNTLGQFSFSRSAYSQDAPTSSLSGAIKVAVNAKAKGVDVSVAAGSTSVRASYDAGSLRSLAAKSITLKDVARVSVLHSSIVDYLLQLTAERYAVLAQWPDFTTAVGGWASSQRMRMMQPPGGPMPCVDKAGWVWVHVQYGRDVYHRAHPEDLKAFYAAVDKFHTAYDALTEFDSLSGLAAELLPGYKKRHQNVLGPAVGPTTANAAVTQFLLAHAKTDALRYNYRSKVEGPLFALRPFTSLSFLHRLLQLMVDAEEPLLVILNCLCSSSGPDQESPLTRADILDVTAGSGPDGDKAQPGGYLLVKSLLKHQRVPSLAEIAEIVDMSGHPDTDILFKPSTQPGSLNYSGAVNQLIPKLAPPIILPAELATSKLDSSLQYRERFALGAQAALKIEVKGDTPAASRARKPAVKSPLDTHLLHAELKLFCFDRTTGVPLPKVSVLVNTVANVNNGLSKNFAKAFNERANSKDKARRWVAQRSVCEL